MKVSDLNEKQLLERIAVNTKQTANNTSTIKVITIIYFVASLIVGFLIVFGG